MLTGQRPPIDLPRTSFDSRSLNQQNTNTLQNMRSKMASRRKLQTFRQRM